MINLKYIESLKPCEDRLDNYKTHYADFIVTLLEMDGYDCQPIGYKARQALQDEESKE